MQPAAPGPDSTIHARPVARRWPGRQSLVLAAFVLTLSTAAAWLFWPLAPPPAPQAAAIEPGTAPRPIADPARFQVTTATEAQIREHVPSGLTVFRFAENPRILVLDFASLWEQGRMLNRVAALVEKSGLPRDRVLDEAELQAAIQGSGDTVETFYFGHDYAASALVRFFALADQQQIELDPQEEKLRALMRQEGWFAPDVVAALISVAAVGNHPIMTATTRAAVLRHELSHGEFFSRPEYAEYVRHFWLKEMSGEERGGVRRFLGRAAYDVREEDLMYNEMQAYLIFTRDPALFRPEMVGLTPSRLAELQQRFLAGMPHGWLRDLLSVVAQ